jgi:hypothetical protein
VHISSMETWCRTLVNGDDALGRMADGPPQSPDLSLRAHWTKGREVSIVYQVGESVESASSMKG